MSFQTLTPEASSRVIANRRERKEAKTKAKMFRKAAKEAKEAKEAKVGQAIGISEEARGEMLCHRVRLLGYTMK